MGRTGLLAGRPSARDGRRAPDHNADLAANRSYGCYVTPKPGGAPGFVEFCDNGRIEEYFKRESIIRKVAGRIIDALVIRDRM